MVDPDAPEGYSSQPTTFEVDKLFSCILPENHQSQAVAKRLGFELLEDVKQN